MYSVLKRVWRIEKRVEYACFDDETERKVFHFLDWEENMEFEIAE